MFLKTNVQFKIFETWLKQLYKSDLSRYPSFSLATINNRESKIEKIPREEIYIFLQIGFLFFQHNITHNVATNTQYPNSNAGSLVHYGAIAVFSEKNSEQFPHKKL